MIKNMQNKQTILTRLKHFLQVLFGTAFISKKEDLTNDAIWLNLTFHDNTITSLSQKAEDIFGNSKQIIQKKFTDFIHKDDTKLRQKFYKNALEELKSIKRNIFLSKALCYRVLYADKKYHWIAETLVLTTDADNHYTCISFFEEIKQNDITLIEQHYQQTSCDLLKYIDFCENIQMPIFILNYEGFAQANKTGCNLYEVQNSKQLRKLALYDVMDVTSYAANKLLNRAMNNYMKNLHFDYLQIDGTQIDIVAYIYPLSHLDHLILTYKLVLVKKVDIHKANKILHSRLFENNPMPMAIVDYERKLIYTANLAARKLYGYGEDFTMNTPLQNIMSQEFKDFSKSLEEMTKQGYVNIREQEHKKKNGEIFYVDIFAFPYLFKDKQMICYSLTDVSEKVARKNQIQKLNIALEYSPNFLLIVNKKLQIEYVNNTFANRCGLAKEKTLGKAIDYFLTEDTKTINKILSDTLNTGNIKSTDMLCKSHDGKNFWANMLSAPIKSNNDKITGLILTGEDLTSKHLYDNEIHKLKLYDNLTGLGNRQYILNKLKDFFDNKQTKASLIVIDIDKLSLINESLGLSSGDLIIKKTADRLKCHVQQNDTLARLGNDEFILLHVLDEAQDSKVYIQKLIDNIMNSFKEPMNIKNHKLTCNISIGTIILNEKDIKDPQSALRCVELALHKAKEIQEKSSYCRFSTQLMDMAYERFNLEQRLKNALKLNQFVLYYQTKTDLNTNKSVGYEALLRWIDENNTLVPPLEFIPFAEESGLILQISDWVLKEACLQSVKWEKENKQAKIAVNLSIRQFKEPDFVQKIQTTLKQTKVNPANIELEITESMLIKDLNNTISLLRELKNLGVSLAIDDFGTGYSSFSYIKKLPIDILKIDKMFIDNLPEDKKDCAIVKTIITLAKKLNMLVVAEGIETEKQAIFLKENNCDLAQGYFYAKPLPVGQIN